MNLKKLECPFCGGDISINQNVSSCFCPYCGRQFAVDDGVKRIEIYKTETIHYRDEARIKELDYQEQERLRQKEKELFYAELLLSIKKRQKLWWLGVVLWIIVFLGLTVIFGHLVESEKSTDKFIGFYLFVCIAGLFAFPSIRPKTFEERKDPIKAWFKWLGITALVFFGSFSVIGRIILPIFF